MEERGAFEAFIREVDGGTDFFADLLEDYDYEEREGMREKEEMEAGLERFRLAMRRRRLPWKF